MAKLDRLHIGQEDVTFSAEPKSITYETANIVTDSNDIRIEQNGFKSVEFVDTQYAGKDKIVQNGFSAFKLVPTVGGGSFKKDFDDMFDDSIGSVVEDLKKINDEANGIRDTVLSLSDNLTQNYLSKAEAYSPNGLQTMASGIKESTATFVTNEQAGQWYGLELETSADGKKYVTGFDMGAVVNPGQSSSDSYFRINADRFIVGGDIGDGNFANDVPAFSIVQNDYSTPRLKFNGLVEFSNINGAPSIPETYIQDTTPYIGLKEGDVWINPSKGYELSTYDGVKWVTTSSGGKTTPGDIPPSKPSVGDVWIDTSGGKNFSKVWDGEMWKMYLPDIGFMVNNNPNVTTIDGGKITTGSISANKINSYNLTAANTVFQSSIIKSAYIEDLSVGTIKIANGAVTDITSTYEKGYVDMIPSYSTFNAAELHVIKSFPTIVPTETDKIILTASFLLASTASSSTLKCGLVLKNDNLNYVGAMIWATGSTDDEIRVGPNVLVPVSFSVVIPNEYYARTLYAPNTFTLKAYAFGSSSAYLEFHNVCLIVQKAKK